VRRYRTTTSCLAPGAVDNYFGHADWAHARARYEGGGGCDFASDPGCCSPSKRAEVEKDPANRSAHLSFVIVGGGPTGVELAGAVKELGG